MTSPTRISIIIPVLREAANINRLISHLRALPSDVEPEIIVVDGDPGKSTITAITDPRVRTSAATLGRANQMNHGASFAAGDVLLFLHADAMLPKKTFSLIGKALADKRAVGGAFNLGIDSPQWYFRVTERYVALRTRFTRIPFGDQAIFIRRDYFENMGGYKNIPIMEDVELMGRIKKNGNSISIIPEKTTTSARRWEKEGVLYATARNLLLQLCYCCGASPARLARFYR